MRRRRLLRSPLHPPKGRPSRLPLPPWLLGGHRLPSRPPTVTLKGVQSDSSLRLKMFHLVTWDPFLVTWVPCLVTWDPFFVTWAPFGTVTLKGAQNDSSLRMKISRFGDLGFLFGDLGPLFGDLGSLFGDLGPLFELSL